MEGLESKYIRDFFKRKKENRSSSSIYWAAELIVLDEPFANLDPSSQIRETFVKR